RLKKFCKKHYLSFQRMREWIDLHDQMRRILKQYHFGEYNKLDAPYAEIHKSLAIGFLRNIARKKEKKLYMTTTGKEVMVFPGSHQFQTSGQWILAASMLETNRLYALTVATIEPEWLEKIGGNLCKYSWDNPRWSENRGHVLADEKVTLFGLVLVSGRQVNFGQRDTRNRQDARNIFIQKALIEGKLKGNYSFLQHNLQLVKKWEETEQRLRKRNILTDDSTLFSFYNDRLDLVIYDRNTLNRYLKKTKKHPHLFLKEKDILHRAVESCELMDFPISLRIGSHIFQLHYSFDPGKDHDGITIRIPINLVEIVPDNYCEWLVPGLLKEKTTFLLKGLPKKLRKHIIPINQAVDKVLDDIDAYKGDYYLALERSLLKQFKIDIPHSAWSSELPPHLKMHYALIDDNDQIIGSGYILREVMDALQKKVGNSKQSTAKPSSEDEKFISTWNGVLVKDWSFTDFPKDIPLYSPQGTITGFLFPVISPSPNKGGVRVSFESDRQQAEKMNIKGMTCLYRMQFSSQFKSLKKYCTTSLSGPSFFWLIEACSGKQKAVEKILQCVFKLILNDFPACIHQNDIYEKNVRELQQAGLYSQGRIICDKILFIIRKRQDVSKLISHYSNLSKKTHSYSSKQFNEYQETLEEIVAKNYLEVFSLNDFEDCDRYLKSLSIRIERGYADS
ncbi:MAG: DUF3418 domain-containing protein, partial [Desulfobacteraceae bacterium]|nr:DUF3418 domain-containing protein [Desulfobacteraceae bacterium]